jgi:hypothetical protein
MPLADICAQRSTPIGLSQNFLRRSAPFPRRRRPGACQVRAMHQTHSGQSICANTVVSVKAGAANSRQSLSPLGGLLAGVASASGCVSLRGEREGTAKEAASFGVRCKAGLRPAPELSAQDEASRSAFALSSGFWSIICSSLDRGRGQSGDTRPILSAIGPKSRGWEGRASKRRGASPRSQNGRVYRLGAVKIAYKAQAKTTEQQ